MPKFNGRVVKDCVNAGSKSERDAVLLVTNDRRLVLRRAGGNAFEDPELDGLVGKELAVEGDVWGQTLLMKTWAERGQP